MGDSGCRKCGEDGHFARYEVLLLSLKSSKTVSFPGTVQLGVVEEVAMTSAATAAKR